MAEVLGVLGNPADTVASVQQLRDAGFQDVSVYSPVPSHKIERELQRGPSRVRVWTLVGGLAGAVLGYLMTIWMAYDVPRVIGGKPFASIPPYTVIAFELTILIGGVLTVIGFLLHGLVAGARQHRSYRPGFSASEFGCLVTCHSDQIPRAKELLQAAGSTEVRVIET